MIYSKQKLAYMPDIIPSLLKQPDDSPLLGQLQIFKMVLQGLVHVSQIHQCIT